MSQTATACSLLALVAAGDMDGALTAAEGDTLAVHTAHAGVSAIAAMCAALELEIDWDKFIHGMRQAAVWHAAADSQ